MSKNDITNLENRGMYTIRQVVNKLDEAIRVAVEVENLPPTGCRMVSINIMHAANETIKAACKMMNSIYEEELTRKCSH
jgi:hypothetical protein